ncbi:hypothetical protein Pmar_PMAR012326, partial [Perkinsus marinus ATCC 50983]
HRAISVTFSIRMKGSAEDVFVFDYERDIHLTPCLTREMLSILQEEAIALE